MSALEDDYDDLYRLLQSGDDPPDLTDLLAALAPRPEWQRRAACRGMGPASFFGERAAAPKVADVDKLPKAERLELVATLRRRGLSLRAIGRELGVSGEQARQDLAQLGADVTGPTSTTVEPPAPDCCARCDVVRECLAAGQDEHGTWGGLSETHRRRPGAVKSARSPREVRGDAGN